MLVAGRINLDTVIELSSSLTLGGKALAKRVVRVFGGSGLNAAIALKRLLPREEVALVGCVGSDWEGREALELLRREGVSTSFITILEGSTGRAFVILEPNGESTSITLPGVNAYCVAPDALREIESIDGVVVMNPPLEVFNEIMDVASKFRVRMVCDFGTELPRLLPALRDRGYGDCVLVPTIHELKSVSKGFELAKELGMAIVIKAGTEGAIAIDPIDEKVYRVPSVDPRSLGLEPKSSSGCGDTFTATLAAYLHEGHSLIEAVAKAVIAAAIKASRLEPYAAPYRDELEEAFAKVGREVLNRVRVESLGNR